jgi:predicted RNA-binding protein with PIN domain
MAGRQVLIDGYNVILADPNLSRLHRESMETARDALVRSVSGSSRFLGDAVTIVFDGPGRQTQHRVGHVTVTYSSTGSKADDVIKARAAAARDPQSVVVVTNDRDIRDYCSLLGCTITGSENLLDQVALPPKIKPNRRPAPDNAGEAAEPRATLSTVKKGNSKRLPKKLRRPPTDYRF